MITLQQELTALHPGEPQHFRNLTLFPLLRKSDSLCPRDYLLLDDAIARQWVRVTELHTAGSVPELCVVNDSHLPVLLVDGEELIGAKQNRVLNLSILVPEGQKCVIPVSCVEAGRWNMSSHELKTAEHFMYATARSKRLRQVTDSMRLNGSHRSNQEAVWEEIAEKSARLGSHSPTRAMSGIFERQSLCIEEFTRSFHWQPGQAGVAYALGGKIAGMDLFDHPEVFQKLFPKLIRSFALDALDAGAAPQTPAADLLIGFLARIGEATSFSQPALGLGKDVRVSGPGVSGAALWAKDRYLHVCAFAEDDSRTARPSFFTRIARPSWRRTF